jgi:hypothetical protein
LVHLDAAAKHVELDVAVGIDAQNPGHGGMSVLGAHTVTADGQRESRSSILDPGHERRSLAISIKSTAGS